MHIEKQIEFSEEEKHKLCELKKLIESCPELDIGTEDIYLSKFLSATDWDVEQALKRIHNYYDFKCSYPNWVSSRLPGDFKDMMALGIKYILPYPDKEGRTIYVHKLFDAFDKFPNYFYDMVEFDDLLFETALTLPGTQRNGMVAIIDMKGLSRSFIKFMGPKIIRIVNKKNDALPFRETHFHVVNSSLFLSTALTMIMPFLGKKMKDKMFFHGNNFGKLRDHLGYESLPHEYGGPKDNVVNFEEVYDILWEKESYLKQLQSYKKIHKS